MKTVRRKTGLANLVIGLALCALRTTAANYYSMQNPDWPPMPVAPFDVPVYDLGGGMFAYDDLDVDYVQLRAARRQALMDSESGPPWPEEGEGEGGGESGPPAYSFSTNDLWVEIILVTNKSVSLVIHAPDTNVYDLYRTFELIGNYATNSSWRWVGRGTNSQHLSFPNARCRAAFYMLGSRVDSDGDSLSDAFEVLSSKTSPGTNHTYSAELTDLDWWLRSNILVNDPEQDCGNEQNSQFETTVAVVGSNVVVAWVDSNEGVYALGGEPHGYLTNYTPRFVAYAVSRDGGVTFEDMGVPPLSRSDGPTNTWGDAGDPVLAVDRASETVYLVGTSPRNKGYKGIPLWKSINGGVTFTNPVIVREDMVQSDKPWLAVDDWPELGQHDLYLMCNGFFQANTNPEAILLAVSTDGLGGSWTNTPLILREANPTNLTPVRNYTIVVGPDHVAYSFWFERTIVNGNGTNWVKMRHVQDRGETLGDVRNVVKLEWPGGIGLKRSNNTAEDDTFRVPTITAVAVNPDTNRLGHVYVAYPDKGTNVNDRMDVFFIQSFDGGETWTNRLRVNTDSTTNDQWMPVLAIKPDGTQLFIAWYDRRNDANNSLIDVYGCWATIATNGGVSFSTEFQISTTNFPPVFAGTDTNNTPNGQYDPVYPPEAVNLQWWYPEWPLTNIFGLPALTDDTYSGHVGEYNGAWATGEYVYVTWTDYRLPAINSFFPRYQSDIRFVRFAWPQ